MAGEKVSTELFGTQRLGTELFGTQRLGTELFGTQRLGTELLVGEQQRLEQCSKEILGSAGTIQPHGVLIAIDSETWRIQHISQNAERHFGVAAASLLGMRLSSLTGEAGAERLQSASVQPESSNSPVTIVINEHAFDTAVHSVGRLVILEFEPHAVSDLDRPEARLYGVIQKLQRLKTVDAVRKLAVSEVRRLTGFDRVMLYFFHSDGHGEIVAEERASEMEPYLGFHYPASDIPVQARALYETKLSRSIVDSGYEPVGILSHPGSVADLPLDLSLAELRGISMHHLHFMKNMGQASTLSLSLLYDGRLIGMITCAHRSPRRIPYALRQGLEVLANQIALQVTALNEIARLRRQVQITQIRSVLLAPLANGADSVASLLEGETTLLDLVTADGALIARGEESASLGLSLPASEREALAGWVSRNQHRLPAVTSSLQEFDTAVSKLLPSVVGIVVVPIGTDGGFIAWYRNETISSLEWLGDQTAGNRSNPFSPRNSFSAWRQTVVDTADPWVDVEVSEAIELSRDLNRILLHQAESKVAYLALHDQLTRLPNRYALENKLQEILAQRPETLPVSLLFIDVDQFKAVNDTLGHHTGDLLLQEAADRITMTVGENDYVTRFGGDEFVVLCIGDRSTESHSVAESIVAAFRLPFEIRGNRIHSTVSVGLATSAGNGSASDILREADTAMYYAKEQGRNRATLFEKDLSATATARFEMEQDLRFALANNELTLNYQTVSRIPDGMVVGVEALLRWNRSGIGSTAPDIFIPLAEITGLIIPIGRWVVSEAIGQLGLWKRSGVVGEDFAMAINISPVQLTDPGLLEALNEACRMSGVIPPDITLEITESSLVSEGSPMSDSLKAIANAGYLLSIDDFGTGHSSLAYLRFLPTAQLKIDKSFIDGLTTSPSDAALTAAIIGLAHDFGMTCVAEGVETPEQLESLRKLDCDLVQGYLLGMPKPPKDVSFVSAIG